MKFASKLLVSALALVAAVNATGPSTDAIRAGCESADDAVTTLPPTSLAPSPSQTTPTPAPSPSQSTPAVSPSESPTTPSPSGTTTAPSPSASPTTPSPNETTPTAPSPSQSAPAPSPSETTSTAPSPSQSTPAPAPTPLVVDKSKPYTSDGTNCQGFLRVPREIGGAIDKTDCQLDFQIKFAKATEAPTTGCVVCKPSFAFTYDAAASLAERDVPRCGGLPICTRLRNYVDVTAGDVLCVLDRNGAAPVESAPAAGCGVSD